MADGPGLSRPDGDPGWYDLNMGVVDVLFHLGELLSGHEREAWDRTLQGYGDVLPFSYEDCWLLMTGIPAPVYHRFGWRQPEAVAFFRAEYLPRTEALLARYGFRGISIIYLFDGRKQLVTLFSPAGEGRGDPLALAEELEAQLHDCYRRQLPGASGEYCNLTVLSEHIARFEDIAPNFARLQMMSRYAFFLMEPVVLTPSRLDAWRRPVDPLELTECFRTLQDAISAGDLPATQAALNQIFLEKLKYSFDIRRLDDAMSYCKSVLRTCCLTYGIQPEEEPDRLCDCRRYASIEDCYRAISHCACALCRAVGSGGKRLSHITREAVYFIRTRYAENIYLSTIADYVNVVPTYLSSVFKRETGQTVNNYLVAVRMERSKELLTSTNLKIAEVAHAVGIQNTRYFSSCFKKAVGVSPNDYRASHRTLPGAPALP